ncbi:hypothetical protein AGMMS49992_18940 [Clostridia bacterium]|nr:hypothetical protein AGMMS49992_18940 [Clostridia bacterium]
MEDTIKYIKTNSSNTNIILISVLPTSRTIVDCMKVQALNSMYFDLAIKNRIQYIDAYAAQANDDGYTKDSFTTDGVRLTADAYFTLISLIEQYL